MKKLMSYNFIKNAGLFILVLAIVLSTISSISFSDKMFQSTLTETKKRYENIMVLHKVENMINSSYGEFERIFGNSYVRSDEIIEHIDSLVSDISGFRKQTKYNKYSVYMQETVGYLRFIKSGMRSLAKFKSMPSHNDTYNSIKGAINDKIEEYFEFHDEFQEDVYDISTLRHLNAFEDSLEIIEERINKYNDMESVSITHFNVVLDEIAATIINTGLHVNLGEKVDSLLKNVSVLKKNSPVAIGYKINESKAFYVQDEEDKLRDLWNKVISEVVYLLSVERDSIEISEKKIIADWEAKRQNRVVFAILGILFVIALSYLLNRVLTGRIRTILNKFQSVTDGDYSVRVDVVHDDQMGQIGMEFNEMAESLEKTVMELSENKSALEEAYNTLEKRVEERTKELAETTKELVNEVSVRKDKEKQLTLFAKIFEYSNEAIVVTDKEAKIVSANPEFLKLTGYLADEALGQKTSILKSGNHNEDFYRRMWDQIIKGKEWFGEITNKRKDGSEYPALLSIYSINDKDGEVQYYVGMQREITALKVAQEELKKRAFYDSLTGLPNRALCHDRLEVAIKMARRHSKRMAVMFLDLDKFKNINDTKGHDAGDELLIEVGKRLLLCARESDTVCRLGGDEFVVILSEVADQTGIEIIAKRIIEQISQPFIIKGDKINTSTSVGITVFPEDGSNSEKLMKNADMAMYKAKTTRRGTYEFYSLEYEKFISSKIDVENRVREAVENYYFVPFFQPVVDAKENRVVGVEVLARWLDNGKIRTPWEFLQILEETGQIHKMTCCILDIALLFLKKLHVYGYDDIWMSLNISPSMLVDMNKINEIIGRIDERGLPKNNIVFEITENILLNDFNKVKPILAEIREHGIKIALDDFGSGYSSLSYLNSLSPDKIKLDRTFVTELTDNNAPNHIHSSIKDLAENMGIRIIAEGVETKNQLDYLCNIGYRYIQGYYYAKPEWEEQVIEFITEMNGVVSGS